MHYSLKFACRSAFLYISFKNVDLETSWPGRQNEQPRPRPSLGGGRSHNGLLLSEGVAFSQAKPPWTASRRNLAAGWLFLLSEGTGGNQSGAALNRPTEGAGCPAAMQAGSNGTAPLNAACTNRHPSKMYCVALAISFKKILILWFFDYENMTLRRKIYAYKNKRKGLWECTALYRTQLPVHWKLIQWLLGPFPSLSATADCPTVTGPDSKGVWTRSNLFS